MRSLSARPRTMGSTLLSPFLRSTARALSSRAWPRANRDSSSTAPRHHLHAGDPWPFCRCVTLDGMSTGSATLMPKPPRRRLGRSAHPPTSPCIQRTGLKTHGSGQTGMSRRTGLGANITTPNTIVRPPPPTHRKRWRSHACGPCESGAPVQALPARSSSRSGITTAPLKRRHSTTTCASSSHLSTTRPSPRSSRAGQVS